MSVLRRLVSVVLVLAACALLPLALGARWLDDVVTDTDTYVDTVAPLAEDQAVRDAVATRVSAAAVQVVSPRTRVEELRRIIGRRDLQPYLQAAAASTGAGSDRAAAAVAAYVEETVRVTVTGIVASPAFPDLWRTANRTAHEALVQVLSAERGTATQVRIDLGPVLDDTVASLDQQGLVPSGATIPAAQFTIADSDQLDEPRRVYQRVDGLGLISTVLVAGLFVLALLVSPLRRRTVVLASVLAALALGAQAFVLWAARSFLGAAADPGEQREFLLDVWDALVAALWHAVLVGLVVAAVLLVGAAVGPRLVRLVRGRPPEQIGAN